MALKIVIELSIRVWLKNKNEKLIFAFQDYDLFEGLKRENSWMALVG